MKVKQLTEGLQKVEALMEWDLCVAPAPAC